VSSNVIISLRLRILDVTDRAVDVLFLDHNGDRLWYNKSGVGLYDSRHIIFMWLKCILRAIKCH